MRKITAYTGPHEVDRPGGAGIIAIDLITGDLLGTDTGADRWVARAATLPDPDSDFSGWVGEQVGAATECGDSMDHPDFSEWDDFI